jgi:hypothetical protein
MRSNHGIGMMKIVAAVFAASVLLAILRLTGAMLSFDSPLFLAELCGLCALGALVVALVGPEEESEDRAAPHRTMPAQFSAPAARRPRWPSM